MDIKALKDKILLDDSKDVLRIHLYTKMIENNIIPFENDLDIILELYTFGGYSNSEEQKKFIDICLDKSYKKSVQSVRNTLTKYTNNNIFIKPKNTVLYVNETYLPKMTYDKIVIGHLISHKN